MAITKWVLTGLLTLVFATTALAGHKHRDSHKNQYQPAGAHQQAKCKHGGHKAGHHANLHYLSAEHYQYKQEQHRHGQYKQEQHKHGQYKQSYQRYPGRTVYRSVKYYPTYRGVQRYERNYQRNYQHHLSYDDERRSTYRLIAGAMVLNEVLHHVHH